MSLLGGPTGLEVLAGDVGGLIVVTRVRGVGDGCPVDGRG